METLVASPDRPQPYEPITLELSAHDVQEVMDAYMAFLQLPEDERNKIVYFDAERPRTGYLGYALRGGQSDADHKHFFHMSPTLAEQFSPFDLAGKLPPAETRRLLMLGEAAYNSLADSARAKYRELQASSPFPLLESIHFPRSGELQHKLRFLAYRQPKDGVLARPHYDKGTGTIAVAESHNGLRIGFGPEDLTLLERKEFEPIFFHGYGWHQLAEMLDVDPEYRRAAWHDVIDTGDRVDDEVTRWALIYFLDPAHLYLESTSEQTHSPIPWRGLGRLALRNDSQSFLAA